jgi:RNA polymerase sigma factor (sigma-70 family)
MSDTPDPRAPDDFDRLLEAARGGDRVATEALLRRSLPALEDFLAGRDGLDPVDSSADLMQSTCREVLADLHGFDDRGAGEPAFRGWLFATARRKLIDRYRYHRRLKRGGGETVRRAGGAELEEMLRHSRSPSRDALAEEQRQLLLTAMNTLPTHYAEVLRLAYFEGLSRDEIRARTRRSSVDAVQALLARATARLAVTMKRMMD